MRQSKYRNEKKIVDGHSFDSRKEANTYSMLRLKEKAGLISNLQLQVKFDLLPAQYEDYEVPGKRKMLQRRRCVEKGCAYYADFTYLENGKLVVVDAKGMRTEAYRIKKKLLLSVHGIQLKEV